MTSPSGPSTGDGYELDSRRIERTIKFALDQVGQLRREFSLNGPATEAPLPLRALAQRLDNAVSLANQCRRIVDEATRMNAHAAKVHLKRSRHEELVAAQKTLMAAAMAARGGGQGYASPKGPSTRPMAAPRPIATGRLTDTLKSLMPSEDSPFLGARPAQKSKRQRHLDAFLRFAHAVLSYTTPRLKAVESALGTTRNNPGKPMMELFRMGALDANQAQVPAAMRVWIPRLVKLSVEHPTAQRLEQQALQQWHGAIALQADAKAMQGRVAGEGDAALADYNPREASGAIMPLTHLPTTFREVPVLNELFPAAAGTPQTWGSLRQEIESLEASQTGSLAPPAKAKAEAPVATLPPETVEDAETRDSNRRLSQIVAYLNNPHGDARYADPAVMFRVVSEEHMYQQQRVADVGERLRYDSLLHPERDFTEQKDALDVATKRMNQMQALMRKLSALKRPGT